MDGGEQLADWNPGPRNVRANFALHRLGPQPNRLLQTEIYFLSPAEGQEEQLGCV